MLPREARRPLRGDGQHQPRNQEANREGMGMTQSDALGTLGIQPTAAEEAIRRLGVPPGFM